MTSRRPDEQGPADAPVGVLATIIDRYNPAITALVLLWVAACAGRTWLIVHERLVQLADEALLSLLFTIPILLAGWGALAIADRWFALGLFESDDER